MPKKKKRVPNPDGRPTKMTPATLAKLENAYSQGFTDVDACILAEIDVTTLHRYCKKNPGFAKKKEALKRRPFLKSVVGINKLIEIEDPTTIRWYAERKGKEEFSLRNELTAADGKNLIPDKILKDDI